MQESGLSTENGIRVVKGEIHWYLGLYCLTFDC